MTIFSFERTCCNLLAAYMPLLGVQKKGNLKSVFSNFMKNSAIQQLVSLLPLYICTYIINKNVKTQSVLVHQANY
jgi:hypothetical protein